MTDRTDLELLIAAAKAAGIEAEWHAEDVADEAAAGEGMWLKGNRSPDNSKYWNPLTCDGDAFRLACSLRINLCINGGDVEAYCDAGVFMEPSHDVDTCAATRRAIVRAAAAIGGAG